MGHETAGESAPLAEPEGAANSSSFHFTRRDGPKLKGGCCEAAGCMKAHAYNWAKINRQVVTPKPAELGGLASLDDIADLDLERGRTTTRNCR